MIRRVTDVRDAALASFRAIGDPAALERDGLFVAESRLIVERLVSLSHIRVHSIAVTPAAADAMAPLLEGPSKRAAASSFCWDPRAPGFSRTRCATLMRGCGSRSIHERIH